jgi:hypothetical protein
VNLSLPYISAFAEVNEFCVDANDKWSRNLIA